MNKAIRDYVANEVTKGYKPGEVLANIQGKRHVRNQDWLDACGGRYLDIKLICNAGRAFLQTNRDTKRDSNKEDPVEQLSQANSFICQQEEWKYQEIRCIREYDSGVSQAIVFAKITHIKTLYRRGYLTLLDSTHNTNILGWKLFSFMVRDEQGMFIPCAHFLASNEDEDIISVALEVLRDWTGGVHGWRLRYMLTDNSAAEQRGVRLAFTGQDEPVGHLLCTKHASDTLGVGIEDKKCVYLFRQQWFNIGPRAHPPQRHSYLLEIYRNSYIKAVQCSDSSHTLHSTSLLMYIRMHRCFFDSTVLAALPGLRLSYCHRTEPHHA